MHRNLVLVFVVAAMEFVFLAATTEAQDISTIAGGGPPNGVTATTAPIGTPWGVVQDSATGNIYISDSLSNRIFMLDAINKLSVVAGNSVNNYSGDGGLAVNASLSTPQGIALDKNGILYIADSGNNAIRVVNTQSSSLTLFPNNVNQIVIPPGDIATVAGNGTKCTTAPACGDGNAAINAQLNAPSGVSVDGSGDIFIADTGDNVIREVFASGIAIATIQPVAGNYTACAAATCGDGGLATSAQLTSPTGLYLDSTGSIYIADTGNSAIRVVNRSGTTASFLGVSIANNGIETVAGTLLTPCAPAGVSTVCGDGAASAIDSGVELNAPEGLFLDGGKNLWIADSGDFAVREVLSSGTISLVAGNYTRGFSGDGSAPAIGATLNDPIGIWVASSGDLLVVDAVNNALRDVNIGGGTISTFAGVGLDRSYYGDGGLASNAEMRPEGITLDSTGDIFVADTRNNAVRKIDTKGNISTVAGTGKVCNTTTCGDNTLATSATAMLAFPTAVALDKAGNVYIADSEDSAIRVVNTQKSAVTFFANSANTLSVSPGMIDTLAGTINTACVPAPPSAPACGDGNGTGKGATLALLNNPSGVALDKSGNIYIADTGDNVIRVANTQTASITLAGVTIDPGNIATVAGDAKAYGACASSTAACGDGANASEAQLNGPAAVFVDASGIIYIADSGDNRIRAVNPQASGSIMVAGVAIAAGDIETIAGTGTPGYFGDKHAATSAEFNSPNDVFVDNTGNIFIADEGNSAVREVIGATGNTQTIAGTGIFGFSGDGGLATAAELALPEGLVADASGDLLIADLGAWRIRKLTAVGPTANLSATSLTFSSQTVGSTSSAQTVTIANNGSSALTVASVAISGADAPDFSQTNTCPSSTPVAINGTCVVTVKFGPKASGTRTATITVTDNAGSVANSQQTVSLTGTAVAAPTFTLPSTGTLSPASVTAGDSATSTITVTSMNGFSASVSFTCSVTPSTSSLAPTCAFNPTSVTPTAGKTASTTLTVSTTAAGSATLRSPAVWHDLRPMFALWLPISGLALAGIGVGSGRARRKKLLGLLLVCVLVAGFGFQIACGGGGGGNNNGGGGSGGTPSGNYTVKVTATSGAIVQNSSLTLTVQ